MYKLIALDMDGTLLNNEHKLTRYTKEILLKIYNKGIKIVLASGRPYQSMNLFVKELGFEIPLIATNGSLVKSSTGEIIAQETIPTDDVYQLLNYTKENDIYTSLYFHDSICIDRITEKSDVHFKIEMVEPRVVGDLNTVLDREPINILLSINEESMKGIITELEEGFSKRLCVVQSSDSHIDIMAKDITKGFGLHKLLEKYGLETEDVIAFGNNFNDLAMLEEAGCGVAMANAPQGVKERADKIAGDNNEDAVAIMLEEIFL